MLTRYLNYVHKNTFVYSIGIQTCNATWIRYLHTFMNLCCLNNKYTPEMCNSYNAAFWWSILFGITMTVLRLLFIIAHSYLHTRVLQIENKCGQVVQLKFPKENISYDEQWDANTKFKYKLSKLQPTLILITNRLDWTEFSRCLLSVS